MVWRTAGFIAKVFLLAAYSVFSSLQVSELPRHVLSCLGCVLQRFRGREGINTL